MAGKCHHCGVLMVVLSSTIALVSAQQGSLTPQATVQNRSSDESSLIGRWQLDRIEYSEEKVVRPSSPEKYLVEFIAGGTLVAQLDCNRGRGGYKVTGSTLTIDPILATLMACGGDSIAREFTKALQTATSFWRVNDTLMLSMPNAAGTMHLILRP